MSPSFPQYKTQSIWLREWKFSLIWSHQSAHVLKKNKQKNKQGAVTEGNQHLHRTSDTDKNLTIQENVNSLSHNYISTEY